MAKYALNGRIIDSVYFPQGAIKIHDTQVVENISPDDVIIDRILGGEERYGKLHLREDRADIHTRWLAPKPILEYVPAKESVGIMIPTLAKEHQGNIAGVTLAYSKGKLNMRDLGKYVCLHHNFRQHLMDYMKSREGQQLAASLNKLGYKAEDIEYAAIGFIPGKAIYAIGRLPNGKVVIYANKDSYKMIEREADAFGMETKELREAAIAEELTHNFRRSYDKRFGRIGEEKATKETLLEFYKTLAETTSNPKLKAKYERIIEHLEHDISTVARYARAGSNSLEELVDLYNADVGELVRTLEGEALHNGINTEKGIQEYVSAKLEEIAEAAKEEYSESKTADDIDSEADGEAGEGGDSDSGEGCGESGGDGGGE